MTYYDVLGVPSNASAEEIKKAYRAQIKFFHPDVFEGNPNVANLKTLQLNEAYETLKDPEKRYLYDLSIQDQQAQSHDDEPEEPEPTSEDAGEPEEPEPQSDDNQDRAEPESPPTPDPNDTGSKSSVFSSIIKPTLQFAAILGAICFALVVLVNPGLFDSSEGAKSMAQISTPIPPTPTPYSYDIESGTITRRPKADALAPLEVNTHLGQNYLIVLESTENDATHEMSFYVEGGRTETVYVPLGEYSIYYATGTTWHGSRLLFGDDTTYHHCVGTFNFYEDEESYVGWTLQIDEISEIAFYFPTTR